MILDFPVMFDPNKKDDFLPLLFSWYLKPLRLCLYLRAELFTVGSQELSKEVCAVYSVHILDFI